jgi:polysaccharide export outer membrane protein
MNRVAACCCLVLALFQAPAYAAEPLLGPGDVIKVSVFGNPDLGLEIKVTDAGTINFPLLGEVEVGGLPPSEVEKKMALLLRKGGYVRQPQVNVMLRTLQSRQVSLLGQVNRPGRYPLDGVQTLTDVLALAGGPVADSGDAVTLLRTENGGITRHVINLFDMTRSGDLSQNPVLMNNDLIFVERAPRCYVFGEVQRPGPYRLERNMTVLQAVSAGGGLSPRGTTRGIAVRRKMADGTVVMLAAKLDDPLQADDVVYVKESLF